MDFVICPKLEAIFLWIGLCGVWFFQLISSDVWHSEDGDSSKESAWVSCVWIRKWSCFVGERWNVFCWSYFPIILCPFELKSDVLNCADKIFNVFSEFLIWLNVFGWIVMLFVQIFSCICFSVCAPVLRRPMVSRLHDRSGQSGKETGGSKEGRPETAEKETGLGRWRRRPGTTDGKRSNDGNGDDEDDPGKSGDEKGLPPRPSPVQS